MRNAPIGLKPPLVTLLVACQLFMLFVPALGPRPAWAQGASTPVRQGQDYYEQSRFDEAISLLKDLVDRGQLAGDDLMRAREIIARSYVKKGYAAQGREMFQSILRERAGYRPDPIRVPPDEMAVFDDALRDYQATHPNEAGRPPEPVPVDTAAVAVPLAPVQLHAPEPRSNANVRKSLVSKWWVWALGAGVVGGVVAAVAGGHPPPPPPQTRADLPPFPVHP